MIYHKARLNQKHIAKNNISNEWNTHKKSELSIEIKTSLIIIQTIHTTTTYIFQVILCIILYCRDFKPAPETTVQSPIEARLFPVVKFIFISHSFKTNGAVK